MHDDVTHRKGVRPGEKFLTFSLDSECYGIGLDCIQEIVGLQKISPVPDMPEHVRGVINLRGQVLPVMDVRSRFRMETREYDDRTCIIVARVNEATIGFVVDRVREVADISAEDMAPPPSMGGGRAMGFVRALGKLEGHVSILLDAERMVRDDLEINTVRI